MSSLVVRKITERAPNAAELLTAASKAIPGVLSVAVMERILLTAISCGPPMVTVMLPSSPAPNKSTFIVLPREMVAPTSEAEPPAPTALTPRTCALGGVLEAGVDTLMSIPLTGTPAATVTTCGVVTGLVPPPVGGGGLAPVLGAGGVVGVELLPPPQAVSANNNISARNKEIVLPTKAKPRKPLVEMLV